MKNLLLFLLLVTQVYAQKPISLPRALPEAEGVSSDQIIHFIDAIQSSKHELHSFMVLRHGKVVAEGWNAPYGKELKHTMYSASKSFTASAIGFAVSEKKLTVEDKVISFFPDKLPDSISPNLAFLRVRDLLSMSVGHEKEPIGPIISQQEDWVKAFLAYPILYKPGTKFLYNSLATYMLSAIVQKVTGEKIIDYLQPRLFKPLGIEGIDWETDPKGINVGGWGLRLKTEDMAKFGQLFLQKGMWKGKQILPTTWIAEASSMKIMQDPTASQGKKDSSDWLQGYCYQMWRSRHNSYRADGANGQFILIFPDLDAVIAITSEAPDMQGELNLIWDQLYTAIKPAKLKADPSKQLLLKQKLASMALPVPENTNTTSIESSLQGNTFGVTTSGQNLQSVSINFNPDQSTLNLSYDSIKYSIPFGKGKWILSETSKLGPYLVAAGLHNRVGIGPFKVAGAYTMTGDKTIEFILRYIESPHTEIIRINTDGDKISIDDESIFNRNNKRPILKAVRRKNIVNPPQLIIRGDDMGFSHSANEALIKCYKEGIESSIEVIVPSPWFPEAVSLLKANPGIDVGLHFAITSEWDNIRWRPLTNCTSIRDEDGYFYQMIYPNANYPKGAIKDHAWKVEDIEMELRAQIDMAKKHIPRLSHISGHMNSLAFDPAVKEMVQRISQEYHIAVVDRDPMNDINVSYIGFDFRNKSTEERINGFIAMLDKLEAGKKYVFVEHPGIDNAELRAINHRGNDDVAQARQDVTTLFTSEKVKDAIQRLGIRVMSYKDVLNSKP
ncbi:MAG: ChbG/HpnK family deacetylase [Saprospiraceae bacterium]